MKRHKITLLLIQLLASTAVLMAESNTGGFADKRNSGEQQEIRDPEMEANQETDSFPDLITFALHLYQ